MTTLDAKALEALETLETFDSLYQLSDIPLEEYQRVKDHLLSKGQSNHFQRYLIGRSTVPRLRNTVRPPGEIYAPVYYNRDYMIKLVEKNGWGGYILALVVWDLLVIDIDVEETPDVEEDHLSYIQSNIEQYYPNDLFYINRTARGYHVYLVSRTVSHASKAAIYMRIKLNSDPAHGTNSLYTGSSLRLTSKGKGDNNPLVSEYLTSIGNGQPDPKAVELYETVQGYIRRWSRYGVDVALQLLPELQQMWDSIPYNFGKHHIIASAPLLLDRGSTVLTIKTPLYGDQIWSAFMKSRKIRLQHQDILLLQAHHQICMNNLYRIFEATEDYAIGVHVQESCYFISYRDLFFVDIDHRDRLKIVYQYVRYHPEATFRIVKTKKGYHAFLTSYPIPFEQCMPLSMRLCADHCHLLSVRLRGYSVRVNQKYKDDSPYIELAKV